MRVRRGRAQAELDRSQDRRRGQESDDPAVEPTRGTHAFSLPRESRSEPGEFGWQG